MKTLLYLANLRLPTEKAYGIQVAKMCEAFAAQVKIELAYPRRKNPIKEDIFEYYSVEKKFKVKKLPAIDFYMPGPLDKIAVGIKNLISAVTLVLYALFLKADIIYSRDELILFLLSFFRKNIFWEAHRFSPKRKFFYSRFKKKGIRIITISQSIKNELLSVSYEPDKILVAHDGVNLEFFNIETSREDVKRELNLPTDKKIVLYSGHLFEWKGAALLLEVARNFQFQNNIENILFVFVGGTEYDINKFRKKSEGLNNVLILGHRPHKEIPLFLKAADALILPNLASDKISSYTSPLKLFEYMASKRPIVASELPSIIEILNDSNSVLVKPDDPDKLAEGIKKVLADASASAELAIKAFEEVQQHTWQKRAGKIINFIFSYD